MCWRSTPGGSGHSRAEVTVKYCSLRPPLEVNIPTIDIDLPFA